MTRWWGLLVISSCPTAILLVKREIMISHTYMYIFIRTGICTLHVSIHHSIPAIGVDHSFNNTFGFVGVSFRDPLDQFQPYSVLATAADAVDRINQAIWCCLHQGYQHLKEQVPNIPPKKQPARVTNMNCKTQKSLCIISTQAFWMALLLQVTSDTSRTSAVVTLPHTETTPPIACSQQAWRAWCSTPHKKDGIILGKTTVVTRSGWHVAKDTSCHLQICRFGEFLNTHARTGTATAEESQEFEAQKCKHICHQHSNTSWLEVSWKTASQASSDVGVDETVAWSFWAERVDQRQFSKAGVGQRRCPSKTMCSWGCCDLKPPLGNRSACFAEAGTINKPRVQFRHQLHHRIQRTPLRNVWKGVACTSCLARVISYWDILHISFHQLVIFV